MDTSSFFGLANLCCHCEDALPTDPGVTVRLGLDGRGVTLGVVAWNRTECGSFTLTRGEER